MYSWECLFLLWTSLFFSSSTWIGMEKMCICVINRVAAGEFNSRDTPWINWMKIYMKKQIKEKILSTKKMFVCILLVLYRHETTTTTTSAAMTTRHTRASLAHLKYMQTILIIYNGWMESNSDTRFGSPMRWKRISIKYILYKIMLFVSRFSHSIHSNKWNEEKWFRRVSISLNVHENVGSTAASCWMSTGPRKREKKPKEVLVVRTHIVSEPNRNS